MANKAIFDFSKMDKGLCTYGLISIKPEEYYDPVKLVRQFAQFDEVNSVSLLTGDWEIILKVRSQDIRGYIR